MATRVQAPVVEHVSYLLWTSFKDGAVVFDQRTGDTHALDLTHALALRSFLAIAPEEHSVVATDNPALAHLHSLGLM